MARLGALACAFLLLAPLVLAAETTSVRSYALSGHGTLELAVPSSWRESVSRPPADLPPTIEFSPASGSEFAVQVTPIWSPADDTDLGDPETIRGFVEKLGRRQLDHAVETEIKLKEIAGPRCRGYLFAITDRAPAKGEWKYLTAGAVSVDGLLLSFTILTNSPHSDDRDQALRMIKQSRRFAPPPAS